MKHSTPPWIIKKPEVIFEPNELPKTKIHPGTYQDKFNSILQLHPSHQYVFTDWSKDNDKTDWAAVLNKTIIKNALQKNISIFTAETWLYLEEQTRNLSYSQICYRSYRH